MKIKWCGVFRNDNKTPRKKPYYVHIDTFLGQTAGDIKMAIKAFIEAMDKRSMKLVDQEIMDVQD